MEEGTIADGVWLLGERDAAVADRLVQALDGGKAAVGERFVDEGPKMFGRRYNFDLRVAGPCILPRTIIGPTSSLKLRLSMLTE